MLETRKEEDKRVENIYRRYPMLKSMSDNTIRDLIKCDSSMDIVHSARVLLGIKDKIK